MESVEEEEAASGVEMQHCIGSEWSVLAGEERPRLEKGNRSVVGRTVNLGRVPQMKAFVTIVQILIQYAQLQDPGPM